MAVALAYASFASRALSAQDTPLDFSCESFPPDVSEAELIDRFGAGNVRTDRLQWAGEYRGRGTVVFPESEAGRLEIIWKDEQAKRAPYQMRIRGERGRWRASNGVTLGTDLLTLERLNRRPFRLAGFQTERQGAVVSWEGGRLEPADSAGCSLVIFVQPAWDGTADFDLIRQVRSGREYSSGHPAMQALDPRVVGMEIRYPGR